MTIGFPAEGRICTECKKDILKNLYNQYLYCAPMAGCFNFCSDECRTVWYEKTIKSKLDYGE